MEALRESEERFRSAFDYATIGMGVVSLDGRWLQVNPSLCEIVGYGDAELLSANIKDITHREDLVALDEQIQRLAEGVISSHQTEVRYAHKQGKEVWAHLGMSLVRDGQTKPLHLIFQIQDITDRKRAEEQLLHDAFHDALTGLPNRALFMDHVKMAIQRSRRNGERLFAALFLDLDRFKIINDSLGHMVGDQPIVSLATGEVSSFEALLRWRHPERGLVMPSEFIPVAEETGLIIPLGQWVLSEACRQMREWQRIYRIGEDVTVSVNLSSRQF